MTNYREIAELPIVTQPPYRFSNLAHICINTMTELRGHTYPQQSIKMNTKEIKKFQKLLHQWYEKHKRPMPWRETNDPYKIWVSEVMLQQTQVNTVIPYYIKFLKQFPNLKSLAEASQHDVIKVWEGLGYYARARNLHRATQKVVHEYQNQIPGNIADFQRLPGVGRYIAAAVLSIAFDVPLAVVDGNVKRVLARLFRIEEPANKTSSAGIFEKSATMLLLKKQPGTHNQAMMELGALICKPANPDCMGCPVKRFCQSYEKNAVGEYPKRIKKKPTPEYHIAVGVILKNDKILITKRKSEGLLGGLWEFPGGKIEKGETPEEACLRELKEEVNLKVEIESHLTQVKHAYTHFKIRMEVFICRFKSGRVRLEGPVDHRWITMNQIEKYAFPRANHKFFPALQRYSPRRSRE